MFFILQNVFAKDVEAESGDFEGIRKLFLDPENALVHEHSINSSLVFGS